MDFYRAVLRSVTCLFLHVRDPVFAGPVLFPRRRRVGHRGQHDDLRLLSLVVGQHLGLARLTLFGRRRQMAVLVSVRLHLLLLASAAAALVSVPGAIPAASEALADGGHDAPPAPPPNLGLAEPPVATRLDVL